MFDAASGGCFLDKIQTEAKELIANRASSARHYAALRPATRNVSQVSEISKLKDQMAMLTSTNSKALIPNQASRAQACGICSIQGHTTDSCPTLQENQPWEAVNSIGFQGNQGGNPFSNN